MLPPRCLPVAPCSLDRSESLQPLEGLLGPVEAVELVALGRLEGVDFVVAVGVGVGQDQAAPAGVFAGELGVPGVFSPIVTLDYTLSGDDERLHTGVADPAHRQTDGRLLERLLLLLLNPPRLRLLKTLPRNQTKC